MLKLYTWITDLLSSERGQDMVEYALITVVVSIGIILAVLAAGIPEAFGTWGEGIAACVSSVDPASCFA
jgi:Flp pilus assembly pilin Flp